jgi:hypothetical protein
VRFTPPRICLMRSRSMYMASGRDERALAARRMRTEGKLHREIAEALGICRATASVWTRGVLPPRSLLQTRRLHLPLLRAARRQAERPLCVAVPALPGMEVQGLEPGDTMQEVPRRLPQGGGRSRARRHWAVLPLEERGAGAARGLRVPH